MVVLHRPKWDGSPLRYSIESQTQGPFQSGRAYPFNDREIKGPESDSDVINRMAIFRRRGGKAEPSRGQTMAEFMLVLPVLLLTVFAIIEAARLLFAWVAVENAARYALRYVVTGDYNPAHYNVDRLRRFLCRVRIDLHRHRDGQARKCCPCALGPRLLGLAGATGVQRDPAMIDPNTNWADAGYFKITVCSQTATSYTEPNPNNFTTDWMAWCHPVDHAGSPGDQVWVDGELQPSRPAALHQQLVALSSFDRPTRRDRRAIPGSRVSSARAGCRLRRRHPHSRRPPRIPRRLPTRRQKRRAKYHRWSPSSRRPMGRRTRSSTSCRPRRRPTIRTMPIRQPARASGTNGEGIGQVEFYYYWNDGTSLIYQYGHTEGVVAYCGFGGDAPCATMDISSGFWPNGQLINRGEHVLIVRALDDEGVYSDWAVRYVLHRRAAYPHTDLDPHPIADVDLNPDAHTDPHPHAVLFRRFLWILLDGGKRKGQSVHQQHHVPWAGSDERDRELGPAVRRQQLLRLERA